MNYGRVKHRNRHVAITEGGATFNVHVGLSRSPEYGTRGQRGSRAGRYNAVACIKSRGQTFRPGAKKHRCGYAKNSTSPTRAVKMALTNLVKGLR